MPRNLWWSLLLILALAVPSVYAANTHGTSSEGQERAAWFGDMAQPHIVSGCIPGLATGSLTTPATACAAYVRATTGELVYVSQAAKAIGPLTGGDGTFWLAVHRDTSTTVAGWTRQPTTHYLWIRSATAPVAPASVLVVAELTVSGGGITASTARAPLVPDVSAVIYVSRFVPQYGLTFAAIQAAIDALPAHGGTVVVEPGTYTGSTSLSLGNGGPGVASTRYGVYLTGITAPNHDLGRASTVLQWTGGAGNGRAGTRYHAY